MAQGALLKSTPSPMCWEPSVVKVATKSHQPSIHCDRASVHHGTAAVAPVVHSPTVGYGRAGKLCTHRGQLDYFPVHHLRNVGVRATACGKIIDQRVGQRA